MEKTVKSVGGIKTSLKNFKSTFFDGLGYLHAIAGALFVVFCSTLLFEKSWLTGINTQAFDLTIGTMIFVAVTWGAAYAFGWAIEEMQIKIFKSKELNFNDMWWTSTGFILADIWLYSTPQSWWKSSWITSASLLVVLLGMYVYYRKKYK